MSTEMDDAGMPVDVQTSQIANAKHQELYPIIAAVPFNELTADVHLLREKVFSSGNKQNIGVQHKGQRNCSMTTPNPDLTSVFPHLERLLQNLVIRRWLLGAPYNSQSVVCRAARNQGRGNTPPPPPLEMSEGQKTLAEPL